MNATKSRAVTLSTVTIGQHFGTAGLVRDARTGRKLAQTETVGLGHRAAAILRAEEIAAKRGWTVVSDED